MKKILLTSTLLVATAGMAAAEITFTGGARFGVVYTENKKSVAVAASAAAIAANTAAQAALVVASNNFNLVQNSATLAALNTANDNATAAAAAVGPAAAAAAAASDTELHNRFTVNINGSATADNGLNFFGMVRIRGGNQGNGPTAASAVSAPVVGVSYEGFRLAVGNINGAIERTPGLYDASVGLTGLGYTNVVTNASSAGGFAWDSFSSGGGGANGVVASYASNGLSIALSHSETGGSRTAAMIAYDFGDWTVALGHQSSDTVGEDMTVATVSGTIGDFGVGAAFADNEFNNDAGRINASYTFGGTTTVTAFGTFTQSAALQDAFGIGFTHSLGGATLAGGIVNDFADNMRADLGVRFSF